MRIIKRDYTCETSLRSILLFFFFTRSKDTNTPRLSVSCSLSVLVQRSEMSARVPRRIMPRVFLSTEVRRCTCAHSCSRAAWKRRRCAGETRAARCTFIAFSPVAVSASASRSRIHHGKSITNRSIASRDCHDYVILQMKYFAITATSVGTYTYMYGRHGVINTPVIDVIVRLCCRLWYKGCQEHWKISYTK